ncbi:hypothetical protein Tco_0550723 [Tanacetum coccineum]
MPNNKTTMVAENANMKRKDDNHNGQCYVRLGIMRDSHMTRECRNLASRILRGTLAHRQIDLSDCPERKNRNHENQTRGAGARGAVHALREGETDQDPNNIKDEIKA